MTFWSSNTDVLTPETRLASIRAQADLLQSTPNALMASQLYAEYEALMEDGSSQAMVRKLAIEEALSQLYASFNRDRLGQTVFDRLTSGAKPSLAALERDVQAGFQLRQVHSVRSLLRRLIGLREKPETLENINLFRAAYPHSDEMLRQINDRMTTSQWNDQFMPSLGFRLALANSPSDLVEPDHLRENAFEAVYSFVQELSTQDDLEVYLSEHPLLDAELLWQVRMKVLFPSLKLAQNGARIHWPGGRLTDEALRSEVKRLNQTLGEMGLTVRQGGLHLPVLIDTQRKLTNAVVAELYENDPAYAEKVMRDYVKYTASLDSFLISIDVGPVFTAGEILIAKVSDSPLTYTVEFLYVDKGYREHYALGTLAQNLALSLVPPGARIIATAHAKNPNLPRHFKRGWIQTGQENNTVYLEYRAKTT